jgi:hypothetical protein
MNTEKIKSSALETDLSSRGFSSQEIATMLLKKYNWRASTGSCTSVTNEPIYAPNIFPEQLLSDTIPGIPPSDFVTMTSAEIATEFGIGEDEIAQFQSSLNGSNAFSMQRSTANPHIIKVTNLRLRPWPANPSLTFSAITSRTKVNLLAHSIPFAIKNGAWRGKIARTSPTGELSRSGTDLIKESQFSYIFDADTGFFTCYERDQYANTANHIGADNPPAITCYLYRGGFGGVVSPWQYTPDNTGNIYFSGGRVLIGKTVSTDPNLVLDVSGVGFINEVLTTALETYSDRRLKENIVPFAAEKSILDLPSCRYNYIAKPGQTEIGCIAQEMEKVAPELVHEHNGFKTVQYDRIGILLLPIVKEQETRIQTLESELHELRSQFYALCHKLCN